MEKRTGGDSTRDLSYVNVKRLVDVFLLFLIIIAAVTPLKPERSTLVPEPPQPGQQQEIPEPPSPQTLRVDILKNKTLRLNNRPIGTINNTSRLSMKLKAIIKQRVDNSGTNDVVKTVFIKAPEKLPYGDVVKVIDAVKAAGAGPVGLAVDTPAKPIPAPTPTPAPTPVIPDSTQEGEIKIPLEQSPAKEDDESLSTKNAIVVSIIKGGRFFLGDREYYISNLRDENNEGRKALAQTLKMGLEGRTGAEHVVYIKADVDAEYGLVVGMIDLIRSPEAGGTRRIGLVADRKRRLPGLKK